MNRECCNLPLMESFFQYYLNCLTLIKTRRTPLHSEKKIFSRTKKRRSDPEGKDNMLKIELALFKMIMTMMNAWRKSHNNHNIITRNGILLSFFYLVFNISDLMLSYASNIIKHEEQGVLFLEIFFYLNNTSFAYSLYFFLLLSSVYLLVGWRRKKRPCTFASVLLNTNKTRRWEGKKSAKTEWTM